MRKTAIFLAIVITAAASTGAMAATKKKKAAAAPPAPQTLDKLNANGVKLVQDWFKAPQVIGNNLATVGQPKR